MAKSSVTIRAVTAALMSVTSVSGQAARQAQRDIVRGVIG
jgi:hypothetical protein